MRSGSRAMTTDGRNRNGYALIGFGRIGRRIAIRLAESTETPALSAVLVSAERASEVAEVVGEARVVTSIDALLARKPDVTVECASAAALAAFGARVMAAGSDLIPLSLAALADPAVESRIMTAAAEGPGRLELAAGAAGSLDVVAAAREDRIDALLFRAVYPCARWRGTPAETRIDLDATAKRTTFLSASAREAVALFPRHINVAAAVSLAGPGLDATVVELAADPDITQAVFEIELKAGPGPVFLRVEGRDAPLGADPVDYTTFSVMRALRRRAAPVRI
jgi:aspartate dehydrogenase